MQKSAFERTGLVPRSIIRTFDRFRRQLLPGAEDLVIQEFRVSKYQVLVSVRCLASLLFFPLLVNYLVKTTILIPLAEYIWNTQQNEIFLNFYQENRAFLEMRDFEEKTFFESLVSAEPKLSDYQTENYFDLVPVKSPKMVTFYGEKDPFIKAKIKDFVDLPKKEIVSESLPCFVPSCEAIETKELKPDKMSLKKFKFSVKSNFGKASPNFLTKNTVSVFAEQKQVENKTKKTQDGFFSTFGEVKWKEQKQEAAFSPINLQSKFKLLFEKKKDFALDKENILSCFAPSCEALPGKSKNPSKFNLVKQNLSLADLNCDKNLCDFKNKEVKNFSKIDDILLQKKFQEKTIQLATFYNQQTISAIANVFGDFVTLITIAFLFVLMKPQIIILKSFLTESIYSLSDTTKSFLLILLTDLLVGFHSPRGWEIIIEILLRHFGLPENQDFVFLFVATLPVLLDTVFKYWIFRYLNQISPSTVATYHSMIE